MKMRGIILEKFAQHSSIHISLRKVIQKETSPVKSVIIAKENLDGSFHLSST